MGRLRLRTKFLIAMLLTSAGLTAITLLIVQRTVETQVRHGLGSDLANSVETFRNVQSEREAALARSAKLMADLPSLKALMTSRHAPTIQDASSEMFRVSGGDLFALIDSGTQFVGFHTKSHGITREQAQRLLQHRNALDEPLQWWFADGHLYEVALAPIYFGRPSDNSLLGVVAVGDEMNAAVAREVSQIAASQVVIICGQDVVVSTLNADQTNELRAHLTTQAIPQGPTDWKLGKEQFIASSLALDPGGAPAVSIVVMKSYDEATAFLNHLSRLLLAVGFGAVMRRQRAGLLHRQHFHSSAGKIGGWGARPGERGFPVSLACAWSWGGGRTYQRIWQHAGEPAPGAAASAWRGAAGHHRQNGELDFARLTSSPHRSAGQRRVSGRRGSQSATTRRALPGNSDRSQPADRSRRFTLGVVAARSSL